MRYTDNCCVPCEPLEGIHPSRNIISPSFLRGRVLLKLLCHFNLLKRIDSCDTMNQQETCMKCLTLIFFK